MPLVARAVNELTPEQRERVLRLVREGLTYRAVERLTGHRRETVSRYVRRAGGRVVAASRATAERRTSRFSTMARRQRPALS